MKRTRFSAEDLAALKSEAEAIQVRLDEFSRHMLAANLAHTKRNFYDSRVRRVCDGLYGRLSAVRELLVVEENHQ